MATSFSTAANPGRFDEPQESGDEVDVERDSSLKGHNAPPQAFRPPDTGAQALELHNLAMIDEEIYFRPIVLHIPCEYLRISRLEHQLVQAKLVDESRRHVRAPWLDIFRDPLAFDHDH